MFFHFFFSRHHRHFLLGAICLPWRWEINSLRGKKVKSAVWVGAGVLFSSAGYLVSGFWNNNTLASELRIGPEGGKGTSLVIRRVRNWHSLL